MLLGKTPHNTPTYAIPPKARDELKTTEKYGVTQETRGERLRSTHQNVGRLGEYIFAKHLENEYERSWKWLDDINSDEWEHDFVVDTSLGGATVDVKTRMASEIPQGLTKQDGSSVRQDPDYWTRFYATETTQKTHVQNHLYVLILLHDDVHGQDDAVLGSVIGVLSGESVLECDEFEKNPDDIPVKFKLPCSQSNEPTSDVIQSTGADAIQAFDENGGFPSIASRLVETADGNGAVNERAIQDEKYWYPKLSPITSKDASVDLNSISGASYTPTVRYREPFQLPVTETGFNTEIQEQFSSMRMSLTRLPLLMLTENQMLRERTFKQYAESDITTVRTKHVLSLCYDVLMDSSR